MTEYDDLSLEEQKKIKNLITSESGYTESDTEFKVILEIIKDISKCIDIFPDKSFKLDNGVEEFMCKILLAKDVLPFKYDEIDFIQINGVVDLFENESDVWVDATLKLK
ncbi:MAG: hypothetical protein Q4P17_03950 [Methanobacterium sp.]|nr:hypothetical protein [Methanobacterium sp.]